MTKLKLFNPVKHILITQEFGALNPLYTGVTTNGRHNGVDMVAFDGSPVYASHDGRVTFAGYDGSGGLGVVIRTNEEFEGIDGVPSYWKSVYWHLKRDTLLVTGGQQVVRGQQIASADNTGMSTGSHLHWALKPIAKGENDWTWYNSLQENGYMGGVDPMPYLVKFQNEMTIGDRGYDVRDLQEFLQKLGYFKVEPTAFYGPVTASAVLAFQKDHVVLSWYERNIMRGIKVGVKTLLALNENYK